jgi:hypothetical protein
LPPVDLEALQSREVELPMTTTASAEEPAAPETTNEEAGELSLA